MERLDISTAPAQPNVEAAIHFARYAIGKNLVRGKRVLDVACGEGYGSYLLRQAGAASVVGLDTSAESVAKASARFGAEGIVFKAADAAELDTLFAPSSFDVVMSVETIEHLPAPAAFLESLKRVVVPGGVIILSCPNDHWYYPQDEQRNPYHLRKYRMDEFQALCTSVLGDNVQWSVGTGVFGFGSTPLERSSAYSSVPGSWMSYVDAGSAYLVSGEQALSTSATQCSYFVGIWNAPTLTTGVAVFPLSMDGYAAMVRACADGDELARLATTLQQSQTALAEANARISRQQEELQDIQRERRRLGLLWQAAAAEAEAMRTPSSAVHAELAALQQECAQLRVGHQRYVRLSRLVPQPLRALVVNVVRRLRGRG